MDNIICQNCNHYFAGNYCNNCGQKVFSSKDKRLGSIIDEIMHFLTHWEGSFMRTFKTVLVRPGRLTIDYCKGIRKQYYKPISFFLLLIVIYLLFPMMEGLNMRLEYYKGIEPFSDMLTGQIAAKAAHMNISEAELAVLFAQKTEKTAKILLLLLIPLTAFVIFLLDFRRKSHLFDYVIAATELNIFFVLFFFILCPILISFILTFFGLRALTEETLVNVFGFMFLMWLTPFARRIFNRNWIISILFAAILLVAHYFITQVIYKVILFQITIALI